MKKILKSSLFLFLGTLVLGNGAIVDAGTDYPEPPKNIPLIDIFQVPDGANSSVEGSNVIITNNTRDQVGSIFSTEQNKINLAEDFESEMYVYLKGDADGIAFTMHNDPAAVLNFRGNRGGGIGIYSKTVDNNGLDGKQLKHSFAVEFDTYYNGDNYDSGLNKNTDKGHVAHSFPDEVSQYTKTQNGQSAAIKHNDIQYTTFKLGDGEWRLFKMNWETWDQTDTGHLTYQYGELDPVTVSFDRDHFASDDVYWGFTGSTGNITEKGVIAFRSVPGLVNYTDDVVFRDEKGTEITATDEGSEVTVHYSGLYTGGKQELMGPVYEFTLPDMLDYVEDSVEVDGVKVSATYTNNVLKVTLPKDLSLTRPKVDIKFKVTDTGLTEDTKATIQTELNAQNLIKGREDSYDIKFDASVTTIEGKTDDQDGLIKADITHTINKVNNYKDVSLEINLSHLAKELSQDNVTLGLTDLKGNSYDIANLAPEYKKLTNGDQVVRVNISKALSEQVIKANGNQDSGVIISIFTPLDFTNRNLMNYFDLVTKYFSIPVSVERLNSDVKDSSHARVSVVAPTGKAVPQTVNKGTKVSDLVLKDLVTELETVVPNSSVTIVGFKESAEMIFDTEGKTEITVIIKEMLGGKTTEIKIPITVIDLADKEVNVQFINEDGEEFSNTGLVFLGKTGEQIDLSEKANTDESKQVQSQIEALETEGYKLVKRPTLEQFTFTKEPQVVTYEFKGTIGFVSVPKSIDFGKIEYNAKTYRVDNPTVDGNLVIKATNTEKFSVAATVEKPLTNQKSQLPRALRYVKDTKEDELILNEGAQEVYNNFEGKTGTFDISQEWGDTTDSKGLKLQLNSNDEVEDGNYSGAILWSIIPKVEI